MLKNPIQVHSDQKLTHQPTSVKRLHKKEIMRRGTSNDNPSPRRRSKRLACRPSATPEPAPKRPRRRTPRTPNLGWRPETSSAAESDSIIFLGRFESPPSAPPVIREVPVVRNPVRERPETSTTTVQASVATVDAWTATAEDELVEIFRIATDEPESFSLDNASDRSSLYYSCEEDSLLFPVGVVEQPLLNMDEPCCSKSLF
ncbi:uncharacterized protein LOC120431275 [Culex pipiens pallens]|uniref:uncharacterized protein LOC120431275 n=1 Tax=Culex pipiens pallens TaxID=42434 RepID=UPI00195341E4|nr:uncharacterized protein LOC120431275 [Culex pipiens pallens]